MKGCGAVSLRGAVPVPRVGLSPKLEAVNSTFPGNPEAANT